MAHFDQSPGTSPAVGLPPAMSTYQLAWSAEERTTCLLSDHHSILVSGDYHDVTLVSQDDKLIRGHRIVLAACSPFFKNLFSKTSVSNLHVYIHGVSSRNISSILEFMYRGSTVIEQEGIETFLKAARDLKVMGLTDELAEENISSIVGTEKELVQIINEPETKQIGHTINLVEENETNKDMNPYTSEGSMPKVSENGNLSNYSCLDFKFNCKGHISLKDHIMNTQMKREPFQKPVHLKSDKKLPIDMDAVEAAFKAKYLQVSKAITPENGYSCFNFKFDCEGHTSLKEHINGTQIKNKPFDFTEPNKDQKKFEIMTNDIMRTTQIECKVCNKGFTCERNLNRHRLHKHSIQEPFGCDQCAYSTLRKSNIGLHMKSHHA